MLGLTALCELVFTLNEVASFTVLSNTPSKGVVMILGEGFDNGVVLILRPQDFFKLVVGVILQLIYSFYLIFLLLHFSMKNKLLKKYRQ